MSFERLDEIAASADARVYAEGWQSWSPTQWWGGDMEHPEERWQHLMRFRPDKNLPDEGVQGEGLLVVDPGDGGACVRFAVADVDGEVASIRARREGDRIVVTADGPVERAEAPDGLAALTSWADGLGVRDGLPLDSLPPRVWCSWYRYFEELRAGDITENLRRMADEGIDVDVIQIDDGWSDGFGHGAEPSRRFGDLQRVVDEIRDAGKVPGIWLAPFLIGRKTPLAQQHPDWLVGDAGFNWGQDLVGLDLTNPAYRDYLHSVLERLARKGIGYLKLDFLYGGAVEGRRQEHVSAVEAYRIGMNDIVASCGKDTYLLGCGAPIIPSIGSLDAMRISPDTFHEDAQDGSRGLRGARNLENRAWMHGRLWANDPDCIIMRPQFALRDEWAGLTRRWGGMRSFSDRVDDLDEHGLAVAREQMAATTSWEPLVG